MACLFVDENQRECASLFPVAFSLIQNFPVLNIVRPITSLIGLSVANNGEISTHSGLTEHSVSLTLFLIGAT